jgi:hypothetical protein
MSAYKIQTPGNYPEESIQHSEHGESLKSRVSKPTLFTDDTSIIFSNSESTYYATEFIVPFDKITYVFAIISLFNLNKTDYVHFTAK